MELFPMVSLMGNLTLVVAVLSYAGQLNLTAVADGDASPDVDVFAKGIRNALEKLARSVETAA
jgi:diacylglycerol O-acyltransferase / wax synthase